MPLPFCSVVSGDGGRLGSFAVAAPHHWGDHFQKFMGFSETTLVNSFPFCFNQTVYMLVFL